HPDGFANSIELIEALSQTGDFNVFVGAYPDVHPEACNANANIDWLKAKLDAGATEALTQFFFEAETFLRFRDDCVKAGIDAPITPGILPIGNWNGARRFAERCGARVPDWVGAAFDKAIRDGREDLLATAICTELCSDLVDEGVETLHFYTLNRPELTREVCHALGIVPETKLQNVA
ncbi:MAG: methylenetetrahydrofolate reductase, partial [Pseudomonadota bacterium]